MLHALPVWAADGTFTLTDRTEVRARNPDPVTNALALDLDTAIDARATLAAHRTDYTLAYLPRLSLLDFNGAGIQPALLHGLLAAADWHSHRTRIVVTEKAGYGQQSFESLAALPTPGAPAPAGGLGGQPTPLPSATLVPAVQTLLVASSETTLASTLQLRPWTVVTRVGYQLSGGADDAAKQALPLQQGPFGDVTADYRVGGRDHLVTTAVASEASFSSGQDDLLVQLEEQWRRRWSRRTQTMVGVGGYVSRVRSAADAPYVSGANPVAEAAVDESFSRGTHQAEVRLAMRVAPFVDRLTGLVDEHVDASVQGVWSRRRIALRAFGTAGESVNQGSDTAARVLTGELDASYHVSEGLWFDAGARALYQVQKGLGPPTADGTPVRTTPFTQTVVFLAVTVRAAKARF